MPARPKLLPPPSTPTDPEIDVRAELAAMHVKLDEILACVRPPADPRFVALLPGIARVLGDHAFTPASLLTAAVNAGDADLQRALNLVMGPPGGEKDGRRRKLGKFLAKHARAGRVVAGLRLHRVGEERDGHLYCALPAQVRNPQ